MAEPLTAGHIFSIILFAAVAILILPSAVKLIAQAVPFLADIVSDIFKAWLEAWREAAAEIKKIFKGDEQ